MVPFLSELRGFRRLTLPLDIEQYLSTALSMNQVGNVTVQLFLQPVNLLPCFRSNRSWSINLDNSSNCSSTSWLRVNVCISSAKISLVVKPKDCRGNPHN